MAAYAWSAPVYRISPEVAGTIFESIEARDGSLTSRAVVEEARPQGSPLHEAFEWDDFAAAEAYREQQAAGMIRCLRVSVQTRESSDPKVVRAFVHAAGSGQYVNTARAMTDTDLRQVLLGSVHRELLALQKKTADLEEVAEVLGRAATQVEELMRRPAA